MIGVDANMPPPCTLLLYAPLINGTTKEEERPVPTASAASRSPNRPQGIIAIWSAFLPQTFPSKLARGDERENSSEHKVTDFRRMPTSPGSSSEQREAGTG